MPMCLSLCCWGATQYCGPAGTLCSSRAVCKECDPCRREMAGEKWPTDTVCEKSESESEAGVFTREWSRATVKLDCNTFRASIGMKAWPS